jgi:hemerythrin
MTIAYNQEKMTTGFPELDEQHQEWFRRFNDFENAVLNRKGQDVLLSEIGFLELYIETHFAREEELMRKYNCRCLDANQTAHAEFRGMLSEIKGWVEQEGAMLVEIVALEEALEEWLINHICTIDVELRKVAPVS